MIYSSKFYRLNYELHNYELHNMERNKMKVKRLFMAFAILCLLVGQVSFSDDDEAIAKFNLSYNRTKSKVMIRLITKPTLANLDFNTYDKNPFFYRPDSPKLNPPQIIPKLDDLNFGGSITSIKDRIEQTPLTNNEKISAMAWEPMIDFLADWDYDKTIELMKIGLNVTKEKWGNDSIICPIQKIATAYISSKNELWVKIEFEPNVDFLKEIDDEDDDSYKEIYALIDRSRYSDDLIEQLRSKYLAYELNDDEIKDYFYKLSAKWYEGVKTETLDMKTQRQFPDDKTEPEIVNELKGLKINNATAVIRGNPYGAILYNVFVVKREKQIGEMSNIQRLNDELQRWGNGDWQRWSESLTEFRQDIVKKLKERPTEIKGFIGKDGQLFFRGSMEYLTSGDLRKQENNRDPFPAIIDFKNQLESKGIDFLFVIIPEKTEIYPDKISDKLSSPDNPYVTPYTRKLMLELESAGVEVIDLLPILINARKEDESIYMKQDTHWSPSGAYLSAKIIADRIKKYPWFKDVCKKPIQYKTKEVKFNRGGDIRDMLPDGEKISYRPMSLVAQQVLNPDGSLYKNDESSPIVILGDSFCGVFEVEDPKSSGLSSHIAKELGMPVDLMVAYGSGPGIRKNLARRGANVIQSKKLVIWTTAARDLYNYWAPWDLVKLP